MQGKNKMFFRNKKKEIKHSAGVLSPELYFVGKLLELFHFKKKIYNGAMTIAQQFALRRLRKIVSNSTFEVKKGRPGKKIVVNAVHGTYLQAIYKEAGLAKALQLRGNDVKIITCGNTLSYCTGIFVTNNTPNKWLCRNCNYFSRNFHKTISLPHSTYGEYISEGDTLKIKKIVEKLSIGECKKFVYNGVDVGFYAGSSTLRFYRGADPKETKFEYEDVFHSRLVNAIISVEVAERVIKKEKPDILLTSHSCYDSWGSFSDYFKNSGISVYTWYTGLSPDTFIFDYDRLSKSFKEYFQKFRKNEYLDKKEKQVLYDFFNKRTKGEKGGGDTKDFNFSDVDKSTIKDMMNYKKYDKTYLILPYMSWDASAVRHEKFFKDVYEWVSHTIDIFKEHERYQLVIKIHPAEKLFRSTRTIFDFIKETYDPIPSNVNIIPPDTKASLYTLLPYIDVGLAAHGTSGLEIALNKIPVIVTGNAPYVGNGFTCDINNKKEYYKALFETDSLPVNKEMAETYAYFHFIKSYIPFKFLYYNTFLDLGWNIKSLDDFTEGENKYLDKICDYILNGNLYQTW